MSLITLANKLSKAEFEKELARLQDLYYNATLEEANTVISDAEYDSLVRLYESKFGPYTTVGAPAREEQKVTLPFFMGSLSAKAKTPKELELFLKKFPGQRLLIMPKWDGIAGVDGDKFITRGNGTLGTDITRVRQYLKLPRLNKNTYVRGEIAISKAKYKEKYSQRFSNSRNMIFGAINSKDSFDPEIVKDFDFLAYRYEDGIIRNQAHQLQILEQLGFNTEWHITIDHPKSGQQFFDYLTRLLIERKSVGLYEIDGLVIYALGLHGFPVDSDPKHSIAFKGDDPSEITEVLGVEWGQSKWGLLKPRINIRTVILDGINIDWATGHNARFIINSQIGVGAIVEVVRSGGVIPKIKKTITPSEPDLPKNINYHWNENQVEFVVDNLESPEIAIKKIYNFFKVMGAKFVGEKTVEKLYNAGFDTLDKFFNASIEDIINADGFKLAGATRIVEAIQGRIKNADFPTVGAASGEFGLGFSVRKISAVVEKFPDFLTSELEYKDYVAKLQSLGGFNEMAYTFADHVQAFKDFLKRYPQITIKTETFVPVVINTNPIINLANQPANQMVNLANQAVNLTNNPINVQISQKPSLAGKNIVFTGFSGATAKELEQRIKLVGAKVVSAVSGKTSILVIKDINSGKSKFNKAEEINEKHGNTIEIIQLDDFLTKYM